MLEAHRKGSHIFVFSLVMENMFAAARGWSAE